MSGQSSTVTPTLPGFLMWRASNAWQRSQRLALHPFGLTHVQYALLATLSADDARKGLSQAAISKRSGVDPMTTSQVIRALELRELLTRAESTEDKRARRVVLTSAGRSLVRRATPKVEKADEEYFSGLGKGATAFNNVLAALSKKEI